MESVEVVGRVGDQIIVRIGNEARLNHAALPVQSNEVNRPRAEVSESNKQGERNAGWMQVTSEPWAAARRPGVQDKPVSNRLYW